mmetsp:Transcript_69731/g.184246  ORF Transcript_69731/g.184246 Transcript_69731/m.184246 type:complete len:227 (-) Transcript_69731:261-941(-)
MVQGRIMIIHHKRATRLSTRSALLADSYCMQDCDLRMSVRQKSDRPAAHTITRQLRIRSHIAGCTSEYLGSQPMAGSRSAFTAPRRPHRRPRPPLPLRHLGSSLSTLQSPCCTPPSTSRPCPRTASSQLPTRPSTSRRRASRRPGYHRSRPPARWRRGSPRGTASRNTAASWACPQPPWHPSWPSWRPEPRHRGSSPTWPPSSRPCACPSRHPPRRTPPASSRSPA